MVDKSRLTRKEKDRSNIGVKMIIIIKKSISFFSFKTFYNYHLLKCSKTDKILSRYNLGHRRKKRTETNFNGALELMKIK